MSDEMTFTFHSPLTEEEWDMITDVDLDHTPEITFHTKHGKEVVFVKRKTGKWMVDPDGRLHCSRCLENPTNRVIIDGKLVYDMTPIVGKMKFCPNCGVRMEVLSDE